MGEKRGKQELSKEELAAELVGCNAEQRARILHREERKGMNEKELREEKRLRYLVSVYGESKGQRVFKEEKRK